VEKADSLAKELEEVEELEEEEEWGKEKERRRRRRRMKMVLDAIAAARESTWHLNARIRTPLVQSVARRVTKPTRAVLVSDPCLRKGREERMEEEEGRRSEEREKGVTEMTAEAAHHQSFKQQRLRRNRKQNLKQVRTL
jgi:hypothetical protein